MGKAGGDFNWEGLKKKKRAPGEGHESQSHQKVPVLTTNGGVTETDRNLLRKKTGEFKGFDRKRVNRGMRRRDEGACKAHRGKLVRSEKENQNSCRRKRGERSTKDNIGRDRNGGG